MSHLSGLDNYLGSNTEDLCYENNNAIYRDITKKEENSSSQISIVTPGSSQVSDFVMHLEENNESNDFMAADEETSCLLSINLIFFFVSYLSFFYYSITFWKIKYNTS